MRYLQRGTHVKRHGQSSSQEAQQVIFDCALAAVGLLCHCCCYSVAAIVLVCSSVTAASEKKILVYRSKKIFLVQRPFKEATDVDNDQDPDLVQNRRSLG